MIGAVCCSWKAEFVLPERFECVWCVREREGSGGEDEGEKRGKQSSALADSGVVVYTVE